MPANWTSHPALTDIRACARELLREQDSYGCWLLKDPRLCQLLPLWLEEMRALGVTPSILLAHRDLREVTQSLVQRDSMSAALAERLWLDHLLAAELCTRGLPRRLVHYSQLLKEPKQTLESIIAWLGATSDDAQLAAATASISSSERHHTAAELPEPEQALARELNQLFAIDAPEIHSAFDQPNAQSKTEQKKEASTLLQQRLDHIQDQHHSTSKSMRALLENQAQSLVELETSLADAVEQIRTNQQATQAHQEATQAYEENAAQSAEVARLFYGKLSDALTKLQTAESGIGQLSAELEDLKAEYQNFRDRATRVLGDQVLPPAQSGSREQATNDYQGLINLQVENNSHTRVIRYLREEFQTKQIKVLEIGCSEGYFGAALKDDGHSVWGIETNAIAADQAEAVLDLVYRDSIEAFLLSDEFLEERFDAIIFGDVLEHLLDPARVLREVSKRLTPAGVIVASVPNVAHERVRMMLLEGRWEYSATGIMDNTHLHFFTRDTLVDLFSAASLEVQRLSAINLAGDAVQIPVSPRTEALAKSVITDRERDIFQFVAMARPNASLGAGPEEESGTDSINASFKLSQQQNILCLPPAPESSLYTIRLGDPLERYTDLFGGEVRIAPFGSPSETDIAWANTIVLQREVNDQQLEMVDALKAQGKRIVFDIDDYLIETPQYLSVHEHCNAMRPKLEAMLARADAVSASTAPLQNLLTAHSSNVFLTPNSAWSSHPPIDHSDHSGEEHQPIRILVASSDSVRVDFLIETLQQLVANENVELVGIGPPGDYLREAGLPIDTTGLMPHEQFKAYAASRDNTIALIPLDDNKFNRCKSAIKYFDYALAGVPCVCSEVEPYTVAVENGVTGLLCSDSTKAWVAAATELIKNADRRKTIAEAALSRVHEHHNLNLTAAAWHELFKATRFPVGDPLYPGLKDRVSEVVDASRESEPEPNINAQREHRTKTQLLVGTLRHTLKPASWSAAWKIYKKQGLEGLKSKWKLVF